MEIAIEAPLTVRQDSTLFNLILERSNFPVTAFLLTRSLNIQKSASEWAKRYKVKCYDYTAPWFDTNLGQEFVEKKLLPDGYPLNGRAPFYANELRSRDAHGAIVMLDYGAGLCYTLDFLKRMYSKRKPIFVVKLNRSRGQVYKCKKFFYDSDDYSDLDDYMEDLLDEFEERDDDNEWLNDEEMGD